MRFGAVCEDLLKHRPEIGLDLRHLLSNAVDAASAFAEDITVDTDDVVV